MCMAMFPPNTVPLRMGLPGIAFPEYSQLPPPPVPPGGVGPEVYDLAILDTPAEALTMPGTSMMADLIIANQPGRQGRVTVQSGCQTLQYEVNPHNPCTQLQGQINGLPFAGNMRHLPRHRFYQRQHTLRSGQEHHQLSVGSHQLQRQRQRYGLPAVLRRRPDVQLHRPSRHLVRDSRNQQLCY